MAIGCNGASEPTPQQKPLELWTSLSLAGYAFSQILLADDCLFIAAGHDGVLVQKPAFFGEWKNIGLSFPEEKDERSSDGVTDLTLLDGQLFAGVFLKSLHIKPTVYKFDTSDSSWTATNISGRKFNIRALATTKSGGLLASTLQNGILLSSDEGNSWQRVWGQEGTLAAPTVFHIGQDELLAGGRTPIFRPFLLKSADDGRNWESIPMAGIPQIDGGLTSIAKRYVNPTELYITAAGHFLLKSTDGGLNFTPILAVVTVPKVFINPFNDEEMLAVNDSLFVSQDGAQTWDSYPSPGGQRLGTTTADWSRRYVAIVEGDILYCLNLNALQE